MKQNTRWLAGAAMLLLIGVAFALTSCSTPKSITATGGPAAVPVRAAGAQLWAQNCGHCHNIRSPNSYSEAQWDVAMLHMRVRANLTAEEHKQILAFLKSAH